MKDSFQCNGGNKIIAGTDTKWKRQNSGEKEERCASQASTSCPHLLFLLSYNFSIKIDEFVITCISNPLQEKCFCLDIPCKTTNKKKIVTKFTLPSQKN